MSYGNLFYFTIIDFKINISVKQCQHVARLHSSMSALNSLDQALN